MDGVSCGIQSISRTRMNQWVAGLRGVLSLAGMLLVPASVCALDVEEGRKEFLAGNYGRCISLAETAIKGREDREDWVLVVAVMFSAISSTQTTIPPTARGTLEMAAYKALPRRFATVHPRYKT